MKYLKKTLAVFLAILTMLSIMSTATSVFAAEYTESERAQQAAVSGGASTQALDIFVPVINSISGNPEAWTREPVTLTINAVDYGSAGLVGQAYSFDGGSTWQSSKSKTFYENQTVSVKVRDAAGNKSITKKVEITKLDTTAPIVTYKSGNPKNWVNRDVTIEVYGYDGDSGVWSYYINGVRNGLSCQKTFSQNQEVKVKVRDYVGNFSKEISIFITKIDKSTPKVIAVSGNATEWTNQDVTLNVDECFCGDSGVSYYSFNGVQYSASSKTFSENQTVRVSVTNKAGSLSAPVEIVIDKIDKVAPTISGVSVADNAENPTQPVVVTVNAQDELSGVAEYSFDGGATWQSENTKEYFESCDNVDIIVKDKAGNETRHSEVLKINVTKPINLKPLSPDVYAENSMVYISENMPEDVLVNSSTDHLEYKIGENGQWAVYKEPLSLVNTYDVKVYARAVDKDGNTSEESYTTVETTFGEYTASYNDIAYGEGVFPVPFERTYSSTSGWFFSFEANVAPCTNGYVFTDFYGEKHHFLKNSENKYVSSDGDELELNAENYAYKVPCGDITCYFGSDGKLAFVKNSYISALYTWTDKNLNIEDQAGNISTVRIADGKPQRITIVRYDDKNLETKTKIVSYQWDGDNLTKFVDAENIEHNYAYTNGLLTQNETEAVAYSSDGRVKRISQPNGAFVKYTYDDTAKESEASTEPGAVTVSDSKGVTDTIYYADGFTVSSSFDNYSDKAVYAPENISNALTSDNISLLAYVCKDEPTATDVESAPDSGSTSDLPVADNESNPLYVKNDDGSYTFYGYDEQNRVVTTLEVAKGALTVTDATTLEQAEAVAKTKITTTYVDDTENVSQEITLKRNSENVFVNSKKTDYTYFENDDLQIFRSYDWKDNSWKLTLEELYDVNGNIILSDSFTYGEAVTEEKTTYTYDEKDRLTEQLTQKRTGDAELANFEKVSYTYNAADDILAKTAFKWMGNDWYRTYGEVYEYNDYGNNTKKTVTTYQNTLNPETESIETTYSSNVTEYVYDVWNQPVQVIENEGKSDERTASVTYDNLGRTMSATEDGKTIAYTYDPLGRVTKVTEGEEVTAYTYSEGGNLTKRTNPNGTIANYDYDSFGNLTAHDYNGYAFTYNTLGSILTAKAGEQGIVSYTYSADTKQNVLDSSFGNGQSVKYEYNAEDEITAVKLGDVTKYSYTYNEATDENGDKTEWTELTDYVNNLKKVIEESKLTVNDIDGNFVYSIESVSKDEEKADSFDGTITKIGNREYTLKSEENKDTFQTNGTTAFSKTYTYEEDELKSVQTGSVSTSYSYNADKLVSLLTNTLKDTTKSFGYEYDKDGNITAETVSTGDVSDKTVYTYDSKKQLTSAENSTTKWEYSYDSRGNILNKKEYAVTIDTDGEKVYTEKEDSTYAYDATWKDELTSFNGQSITYDASGNPLNYMGHNLTWTMGRQLASFDDITYTYNEEGIRTSKTSNGVTTKYYLNGTNIIEQTDGTNTLHFYYDSRSELIGFNYADNDYFYVKNQQGDITDIVDADGNVVASYVYDPWGAVISVSGSNLELANLNPFRYRSYYYDSDIEMYYLQSRYYDANVCRFINCDNVSYIGKSGTEVGYNPFAYCENDSVNYSDLSGNDMFSTIKKAIKIMKSILGDSLKVINLSNKGIEMSKHSYFIKNMDKIDIYANYDPNYSFYQVITYAYTKNFINEESYTIVTLSAPYNKWNSILAKAGSASRIYSLFGNVWSAVSFVKLLGFIPATPKSIAVPVAFTELAFLFTLSIGDSVMNSISSKVNAYIENDKNDPKKIYTFNLYVSYNKKQNGTVEHYIVDACCYQLYSFGAFLK